MPRRSPIGLREISSLDTLAWAFWRASRGFQERPAVRSMGADLDAELARLGERLRAGAAPAGRWRRFTIHDPKRREILAPCFRDRVVHHAILRHVGPVLERALVDDTYACRPGRGTLAAVQRAQEHLRRFPWFAKVDMRAYFASIDHGRMLGVLERRFKNPSLVELFARILATAPVPAGRGLPIGALTSQHFANIYLDAVDRLLMERLRVRGMVRYMDDLIWWCDSGSQARETMRQVRAFAWTERQLDMKPGAYAGRSTQGVSFLGFRVMPGTLRLMRRRRRRYSAARARCEAEWRQGAIDAVALQAGVDAALAITAHADARAWRTAELRRRPPVEA
ncbi:MAG: group II intron reverse transcriptase domain-containing protein [Alphaproteobacteria bacterium]|nr:group II intron reverse transcriptase domain-containing protein [Alphaproteobacteria bacterium]